MLRFTVMCLFAMTACTPYDIAGTGNRFAGCYDNSCVGAPQRVPGLPPLVSLSSTSRHTCGLTAGGEAWCWGDNTVGQLGDGTATVKNAPVKVAGGLTFTAIAAGAYFTCGLASATIYCWGAGSTGLLGQRVLDSATLSPEYACGQYAVACAKRPVPLDTGYIAIAAGMRHACAVTRSGVAKCWGYNSLGEIGSASYDTRYSMPRVVPGTQVYASIFAGDSFTCALTTAGRAWCWGAANRGQLGSTTGVVLCGTVYVFQNLCSPSPHAVNTAITYVTLSLSMSRACGLSPAGVADCWGDGNGALGEAQNPAKAETIVPGTSFSAIDDNSGETCATPVGKPSVCWGVNIFGRLGTGTRIELSNQPLPIKGEYAFTTFAGGDYHMCALTAAGDTYCWGSGRFGELGTGPLAP